MSAMSRKQTFRRVVPNHYQLSSLTSNASSLRESSETQSFDLLFSKALNQESTSGRKRYLSILPNTHPLFHALASYAGRRLASCRYALAVLEQMHPLAKVDDLCRQTGDEEDAEYDHYTKKNG